MVVVWLAGAEGSAGATTTGGGTCTTGGGVCIIGAGAGTVSTVFEKHPERSPPTVMNMTIDEMRAFKRIALTSLSTYLSRPYNPSDRCRFRASPSRAKTRRLLWAASGKPVRLFHRRVLFTQGISFTLLERSAAWRAPET